MKRAHFHLPAVLLVATALGVLGCGENNPLAPEIRGPNEIWIQNSQFVPAVLTVAVGTSVKWVNKDNISHTVDSGTPQNPVTMFNSPVLDKRNMSFTWTFSAAGKYFYFCSIHGQQGQVVVQ
jgi:plastocyanin